MGDRRCLVMTPCACDPAELEEFVSLVRSGGEVDPHGLGRRVRNAHSLAFLRSGNSLIGVAGLKFPSENYRAEVSAGADVSLPERDFPLEFGWVFVCPDMRGGVSRTRCVPLCSQLWMARAYSQRRVLTKKPCTRHLKSWALFVRVKDGRRKMAKTFGCS